MVSTRHPVAVVTGAARGIGAAVTAAFEAAGWCVIAIDRAPISPGMAGHPIRGDVRCEETWARAIEAAGDVGDLRAIINNAGVQGAGGRLVDTEVQEFRDVLAANVESAFLGTRAGLRELRPGGAVVNVASNAGLRGVPRFGPYSAAKHAVLGLTRTAALEGARLGIRVNALCPGPTNTRIMEEVAMSYSSDDPEHVTRRMRAANPSGRFAEPEEVAAAVVWLAGDTASYVNGAVLTVDGGLTAA